MINFGPPRDDIAEVPRLSLAWVLGEILERVRNTYAAEGVSLPDRQYWTAMGGTEDCEQLVVSLVQVYIGPVGDEASGPQRCDGPRSASIDVKLTRCIPTHSGSSPRGRTAPPTEEQIQAGAQDIVIDAWMLLDAAANLDVWNHPGPGGPGIIATVDITEPGGGFQSTILHLNLQVP